MCSECSPAEQLWALVHDAHEILSGEITRECMADETRAKLYDADAALRSALGISDVDLLKVHCADIKHGAIEKEVLDRFIDGSLTQSEIAMTYHFSWYGSRHKWAELFEELRSEL